MKGSIARLIRLLGNFLDELRRFLTLMFYGSMFCPDWIANDSIEDCERCPWSEVCKERR